jgi:3',5'-cyclic AMP phosphodiesterase CpdA
MVILHISDLHFGVPTPPAETVARQLALGSLGEHLAKIEAEWRPTAVLVGGDLAWSGSRDEFDLCGEWLDALLRRLEVPKSALAACAGNHDISRQATFDEP